MVEQHALDQEPVKQSTIWLLSTDQLAKEKFHSTIKHTSIVKGPAHDVCMLLVTIDTPRQDGQATSKECLFAMMCM